MTFLSRYPLSFHEDSKSYNKFIDLSSTTKTINAIKTVYTNNISSFIPFNKLVLQNFQIKSVGLPEIELKTVINDQKVDSIIGSVYEAAVNKIHPLKSNLNSFSRKSKILFRYWKQLKLNNKQKRKLVLPPNYHNIVYTEFYIKMGHVGHKRVFNLVETRFYWPNHVKGIHDFVTKKCSCLKDKRPSQEKRAPLVIIVTQEPLEHIAIDYLHLSKSKERYEYLLIAVDHFNKYVQAFPTINKSGRPATDLLFNNQVGQQLISYSTHLLFKGPSKICGRQPLKILKCTSNFLKAVFHKFYLVLS